MDLSHFILVKVDLSHFILVKVDLSHFILVKVDLSHLILVKVDLSHFRINIIVSFYQYTEQSLKHDIFVLQCSRKTIRRWKTPNAVNGTTRISQPCSLSRRQPIIFLLTRSVVANVTEDMKQHVASSQTLGTTMQF